MTAALARYYNLRIGCAEWEFYARGDVRAVRVAERMRRLVWPRWALRVITQHRGSMAHSDVVGWYGRRPAYQLYSREIDGAGVIGCGGTGHYVFDTTVDPIPDHLEEVDQ